MNWIPESTEQVEFVPGSSLSSQFDLSFHLRRPPSGLVLARNIVSFVYRLDGHFSSPPLSRSVQQRIRAKLVENRTLRFFKLPVSAIDISSVFPAETSEQVMTPELLGVYATLEHFLPFVPTGLPELNAGYVWASYHGIPEPSFTFGWNTTDPLESWTDRECDKFWRETLRRMGHTDYLRRHLSRGFSDPWSSYTRQHFNRDMLYTFLTPSFNMMWILSAIGHRGEFDTQLIQHATQRIVGLVDIRPRKTFTRILTPVCPIQIPPQDIVEYKFKPTRQGSSSQITFRLNK